MSVKDKIFQGLLICCLGIVGCKTELRSVRLSPTERPNFVLIITEDIGCYLGCYGDSTVKTPNLSKLAEEGMVMTRAFSTAGVCAPSRAGLITGMYPSSIGANHMRTRLHKGFDTLPVHSYAVVPPPEVRCFTQYLREAGYYCTNQGKTDWQFEKTLTAFDDYGMEGAHWQNRKPGQPFFCIFNIFDTHESQLWQRDDHPVLCDQDMIKIPPYYPETQTVKDDIARMYSNIVEMDNKLGTILDDLRKDKLLDSTYVIFLSDHGGPLPRQKREILDAGLHVPMIIRCPNAKKGGTCNHQLVSFIDIAPTILSLADLNIPEHLQGKAFLGKQKTEPRKYIFGARDRMDTKYDRRRSVRDERFIYIKNYNPEIPWYQDIEYRKNIPMMKQMIKLYEKNSLNNIQKLWFRDKKPQELLFDLENDPYEIHNLVGNNEYEKKLLELRKVLSDWEKEIDDKGNISEYKLVEQMWPDFIQPQTEKPGIKKVDGKIIISCQTPGSSIAYQISNEQFKPDDSEPNNWNLYNEPLLLEKGQILYALAVRIGYKNSDILEFNYH